MIVIYCIENKFTRDRYVGSTINFYKRKQLHLKKLRNNVHHSPHLQNSWNKHGEEDFVFLALEKVGNKSKLLEREQWWIDNTNSKYNICKIAGNSLGVKRRQETKDKVRAANLGLKHPDWRNKIKSIAQGGKNHWTKKKKFSDESKKKMSESHKRLYQNGYSNPRKKTIEQLTLDGIFIKEWKSILEAATYYNIDRMTITNCAKGRSNTSCGFKWKFKS